MAIISVLNAGKTCQNAVMGRQLRTNNEQRSVETYKVYKMKLENIFFISQLLSTFHKTLKMDNKWLKIGINGVERTWKERPICGKQ